MIRINTQESPLGSKIEVEGQLSADYVDEVYRCWLASRGYENKSVVLDLSGIIYVDLHGRRLLREMSERGVIFVGARLAVADALQEALKPNSRRLRS